MDEATLIRTIQSAFGPLVAPGAWGFSDDAAMLPPVVGARARVVTTDVVVEGRDFDLGLYPARYAGYRALAQNVSDLSAMGAFPIGFVWSIAIPPRWLENEHLLELARGAAVLAKLRNVPLFGGDLSATSGPLVVSITALGDADGLPVRRSGARPGDAVWLSRPVGGSAAGLRALRGRPHDGRTLEDWLRALPEDDAACVRAHLTPLPEDPQLLVAATAAIDVSDGLALDAHRLAFASDVRLDLENLEAATAAGAMREDALGGGEDYALLFTTPAAVRVPAIRLGRVVAGAGVSLDGTELAPLGYDHFLG